MQVLCVCISKKLIKWLEGNHYYHKLQIKQQHALLVHILLNIKYISHKVIGGGTHQTPDDMILSQYFTHDTILLHFLTCGDKLSIAITSTAIYHLFSTANDVLKIKICQYRFYPIT